MTDDKFKNWLFLDLDDKGEGRYRVSYIVEQCRGKRRQGRAEIPFLALSCLNSKKESQEGEIYWKSSPSGFNLNIKIRITRVGLLFFFIVCTTQR